MQSTHESARKKGLTAAQHRRLTIGMVIVIAVGLLFVGAIIAHSMARPANPEAEAYITCLLTDPASAQFKDVEVTGPCVQGKVNAKNRMGGYVGFETFFYNLDDKEGAIDPGQPSAAELMLGMKDGENAINAYSAGFVKCVNAATSFLTSNEAG